MIVRGRRLTGRAAPWGLTPILLAAGEEEPPALLAKCGRQRRPVPWVEETGRHVEG
jgi:hypothetical protein